MCLQHGFNDFYHRYRKLRLGNNPLTWFDCVYYAFRGFHQQAYNCFSAEDDYKIIHNRGK